MARELLIALLILVSFLFAGRYILLYLNISEPSLSISGGIILFLIALKMIFSAEENIFGPSPIEEPFIVPLATPFIAGPSAMATVLLLMAREPHRWIEWFIAVIISWGVASTILFFSQKISNWVGHRVLTAIERLMGMLLTMVAVEMFINGLKLLHVPITVPLMGG